MFKKVFETVYFAIITINNIKTNQSNDHLRLIHLYNEFWSIEYYQWLYFWIYYHYNQNKQWFYLPCLFRDNFDGFTWGTTTCTTQRINWPKDNIYTLYRVVQIKIIIESTA